MQTQKYRGGWTAWPVVIILLLLGLWWLLYIYLSNPGGRPHSIILSPPVVSLVPGVPQTVQAQLVLNHPIPNATVNVTYDVDIDEDDAWDDDLIDVLTLTRTPSSSFASGSFQLTCSNVSATGEFDLKATPGSVDISKQEVIHYVHAEGPGNNSPNISVICPVAGGGTGTGTGVGAGGGTGIGDGEAESTQ